MQFTYTLLITCGFFVFFFNLVLKLEDVCVCIFFLLTIEYHLHDISKKSIKYNNPISMCGRVSFVAFFLGLAIVCPMIFMQHIWKISNKMYT